MKEAYFIKARRNMAAEQFSFDCPAPMFRRSFSLPEFKKAELIVCGLGYGYYFLNGERVSRDMFTAAPSDYTKTLWFNRYDVTSLLRPGRNIAAAICGNGWYNEGMPSAWDHDKAHWRGNPKFIMWLAVDGEPALVSDADWICTTKSPIVFNQLRSGEWFDGRLYDPNWCELEFDDSDWERVACELPPEGAELRECVCEPIREIKSVAPKTATRLENGDMLYDFGKNMSGYIRLSLRRPAGEEIVIRYAEQVSEAGELILNNMGRMFPESPFMTDKLITNGVTCTHSPLFAYHGFRYALISGLAEPERAHINAVEVHQDVKPRGNFRCSNPAINTLCDMAKSATLSNLFYMPTDCPTREKLGWANDAAASAEQMLANFGVEKLFEKWLVDILDSQREDGALPGIIPSPGWGYEWGSGPLSGSVLFEIPYRLYEWCGLTEPLKTSLPAFLKYLEFNESKMNADGLIAYGLCDWAGPFEQLDNAPTPVELTDSAMLAGFYGDAALAADLSGLSPVAKLLRQKQTELKGRISAKYIGVDGRCTVAEQSAVAMLVYHGIYSDISPLSAQLKELIEARDFHHNCGMVGLRRLYRALDICGLTELGVKIIASEGYPSYTDWIKRGCTTLPETFQTGNSQNHHMYSSFVGWLAKSIAGLSPDIARPGFAALRLAPHFVKSLDFAHADCDTVKGKVTVAWQRENGGVTLSAITPADMEINPEFPCEPLRHTTTKLGAVKIDSFVFVGE